MKNYQPIAQGKSLVLKISLLLLVSIFYSSTYAHEIDSGSSKVSNRKRVSFINATVGLSNCVGDFESGVLSPWNRYAGNNSGYLNAYNDNIHFYNSNDTKRVKVENIGNDPNINSIQKVKFGNHSVRVGNSKTGSDIDKISRDVVVTDSCFSFWYALIFQQPNHGHDNQPYFIYRLKDSIGNIIDSFSLVASLDTSIFSLYYGSGTPIAFKDWTKYSHNLSSYLNQTITIEFISADCLQGQHFGYAYIDNVCFGDCLGEPCDSCDKLINNQTLYDTYPLIYSSRSSEDSCCFKVFGDPGSPLFNCLPHGVKVYDKDTQKIYFQKFSNNYIVGEDSLEFCLKRNEFTENKTFGIALYDKFEQLMCDSLEREVEPCFSQDSDCNCNSLFALPEFREVSIISRDTNSGELWDCCFRVNPYTDDTKLNCPYFGLKIYKEGNAHFATYLDTLNPNTPMGGAGSNSYPDSLNYLMCLPSYTFSNGPINIRIEYLDSLGKVICSKNEKLSCESNCCDSINYHVGKISNDSTECCYKIDVMPMGCPVIYTVELIGYVNNSWTVVDIDTVNPSLAIRFDVCVNVDDTGQYVLLFKDSLGNVKCQKAINLYCKDCCKDIETHMIPVPSPPVHHGDPDLCCWDFYYYPQSFEGCPSPYSWYLYDEHDTVPQQFPMYLTSMGYNMGRHCVIVHSPAPPPPGVSYTVWTSIKKQLALYDVNGNLICIKIMEDSCSRTYSTPGEGDGTGGGGEPFELTANPNPSSGVFGVEMNLPSTMPVEIKVINSNGVQIFQNNYGEQPQGQFTTTINISGQPNGVYILLVNNGEASIQVVKQ